MSLVMYAGSTHRITGTFDTGSMLHYIDTHPRLIKLRAGRETLRGRSVVHRLFSLFGC